MLDANEAIRVLGAGQLEPRDDESLWFLSTDGSETMIVPPPVRDDVSTMRSKAKLIGWRIGRAIGVLLGRYDSER